MMAFTETLNIDGRSKCINLVLPLADGLVQLPQNLDFLSIWFEEVLVEVIECGLISAMDVVLSHLGNKKIKQSNSSEISFSIWLVEY